MEELLELKELLQHREIDKALLLVEDLEEMGKKGITRNIRSYAIILLLHLIKQQVEQRTTKSWSTSIRNAVREIQDLNTRPQAKGFYLSEEELKELVEAAWDSAIDKAALEAAEGIYNFRQLEALVNKTELIEQALVLIKGE